MVRVPAKLTNERRENVWHLMLTGYTPQQIIKTLGSTQAVIYNDIKFLTKESKAWMYSMAKGTHVLMYKKAIESTNLVLSQCWNKFTDQNVPEKQKVSYLRLVKECNQLIYELTANGPTEMAVLNITERAHKLGIGSDPLTEQEQIQRYINHSDLAGFDVGNRRDRGDTNTGNHDFELTK